MRAIIIQDYDAANLLDSLKLQKFNETQMFANSDEWHKMPKDTRDAILSELHRKFHYIVCRWLEEQGATGVR